MSAPIRNSSPTYRNRLSNTFSVTMEVPSAVASMARRIGWKSVAMPGYGSVTKSTARARVDWRIRSPASDIETSVPVSRSFERKSSRCSGRAFSIVTSPCVATAPAAHVPASMRSGTAV